jgi:hypothetical protein
MEKVMLEQVTLSEAKIAKNGKPYHTAGIKVAGVWYNGIFWENDAKTIQGWTSGMAVYAEFFEEEWEGKIYKKFKLPSKFDLILHKLETTEKLLITIAQLCGGATESPAPPKAKEENKATPPLEREPDESDMPF